MEVTLRGCAGLRRNHYTKFVKNVAGADSLDSLLHVIPAMQRGGERVEDVVQARMRDILLLGNVQRDHQVRLERHRVVAVLVGEDARDK